MLHFSFRTLFAILFLTSLGCSSNTVRMTPEETQEFLSKHPGVMKSLTDMKEPESNYRHRYLDCSEDKKNCWKVECTGLEDHVKCWKTPTSPGELNQFTKALSDPDQIKASKETCEASNASVRKRRALCFDYLAVNSPDKTVDSLLNTLRIFCGLEGVSCMKNGVQTNHGIVDHSPRRKLRANSLQIRYPQTGKVDLYEYTILD